MEKRDGARFFQVPKWTSIFIFQHVLCLLAVVSGCQTQLHSMTVSQPAIPFQTESVKCVAPRTEDKCRPQRLSHVLRATECFLQTSSFILHHQRHSRFFFCWQNDKRPLWIKRPWHQRPRHVKAVWNFLGQSLAPSGWHLSQFRGAWVGWGELGLHETENLTFKALISFKRFAWSKRQAILSPSSIFFSCCSHYKSTSKGSPPLTICCIVS